MIINNNNRPYGRAPWRGVYLPLEYKNINSWLKMQVISVRNYVCESNNN